MKTTNQKKNMRKDFARKGKLCPNCGLDISRAGHFVPALGIWTCEAVLLNPTEKVN